MRTIWLMRQYVYIYQFIHTYIIFDKYILYTFCIRYKHITSITVEIIVDRQIITERTKEKLNFYICNVYIYSIFPWHAKKKYVYN